LAIGDLKSGRMTVYTKRVNSLETVEAAIPVHVVSLVARGVSKKSQREIAKGHDRLPEALADATRSLVRL
jgi:hypothetical protein